MKLGRNAIIVFVGILGIALSIGIHETPDSFLYMNLGQYLWTGIHVPVRPWNETHPQTLFGPVYPLLATPLLNLPLPWSQVLLPASQLLLLLGTCYLVYKILVSTIPPPWPTIGACIFMILPFNILYATLLMSETLTQFLLTLWLFLLMRRSNKQILVAALLTLTRYAYGLVFLLSINKRSLFSATLGALMLLSWMLFNYKHFGVWTLSMVTGRHIYNNVVTQAHLLPPDNDPTLITFRTVFSDESIFFRPWWDNQYYFDPSKFSERDVDVLYLRLSVSAIAAHPFQYAAHLIRMPFQIILTPPYVPLSTLLADARCTKDSPCRAPWNSNLCRPILENCFIKRAWGTLAEFGSTFHSFIAAIWLALSSIGIMVTVRSRKRVLQSIAQVFILMLLAQAWTEWGEGRFFIPLYGAYAILITIAIKSIYGLINHRHSRV